MIDQLIANIKKTNAPIVVGLDPMMKFIPEQIQKAAFAEYGETLKGAAEAIWQYNKGIVDAVADLIPAVKPQIAMYEQFGVAGLIAFQKTVAYCKEKGLVVIGGDGSFRGAADLSAKGIACVGLPGTIDNDIACTEYTIGYDTAMNTCVEMIDKLQDTCQSHDRCSVVEVMGRGAGFIAVNTGLASGAVEIITKEVPYDLDELARKMLECKKNGKQNFIVVVAENIGNAEGIARAIQEKTGIESRATVLGHVQRGGSPTVRDRVVASEMGYYAVELLEKGASNRVVGMQNNKIVDFDIQEALSMKKPYEEHLHQIAQDIAFF